MRRSAEALTARSATDSPAEHHIEPAYVSGTLRLVYIGLGGFFFVLAMIGVVLPGLPTTPFLLLTSYFLARSWPRMHRALLANRYVGPILRQWNEHRAIELRTKVRAAATIVLCIALMAVFSGWPAYRIACVGAFSCIGLVVIYRLPTLRPTQ